MPTRKAPRKGSLQFWPRKRAAKFLPRVNWSTITNTSTPIKGIICYKAGMASALVKDNTPNSMTKGKKIAIPVTILECPGAKIFSVRFYKNGIVHSEYVNEHLDKELKKKVKVPKKNLKKLEEFKEYDDITLILYSVVKKTGIKKTPDLLEVGLSGSVEEKLTFVKEHLQKEMSIVDIFSSGQLVDVRGLTKGKGFQGPVKRFGITLRQHKSEKGVRKVGSIGPWHPARVTFRTPMAGQLGMFSRISYNKKIIALGKGDERMKGIKNYGDVKTDYIILAGSIQGPSKRQLAVTCAMRPTKDQMKKQYEFVEVVR